MNNSEITKERIVSDYEYTGLKPCALITYDSNCNIGCALGAMAIAKLLREGKQRPRLLDDEGASDILGLTLSQKHSIMSAFDGGMLDIPVSEVMHKDIADECLNAALELRNGE